MQHCSSPAYKPRDPQSTVLWNAVHDHWQEFVADANRNGRDIPTFIERAFEKYLGCGDLAKGFARVRCKACHRNQLVPFSCKVRGLCPSCDGRRMSEQAAHLVDNVFPEVAVRQFVLTVPYWLRYKMAWDHQLTGVVLGIFTRTIRAWYRKRARAVGAEDPRCAGVTLIQRFGDGVRLSPHFHTLFCEGAWSKPAPDWPAAFYSVAAPDDDDIAKLVATIRRKVLRKLLKIGVIETGEFDELAEDDPLLAVCTQASLLNRVAVGERRGRLVAMVKTEPVVAKPHGRRCAMVDGFNLHANTYVPARARPKLERLCRYITRPAICNARLRKLDDGQVLMKFKRPWANGAIAKIFEPIDFIAKLLPLVVKPRVNLLRYHGQFAANAAWRDEICPQPRQPAPASVEDAPTPQARHRRFTWSELLKRCFAFDVLKCHCGGTREVLALISSGAAARRILAHLDLPTEPRKFRRAHPPPELWDEWFDDVPNDDWC